MIELIVGIALGFALGVFRAQVWAGIKKLFGKAEAAVEKKIHPAPAPKAPDAPKPKA